MKSRTLGWAGVRIPILGQGTWQMEYDDPDEAVRALRTGLDRGMTHVDTAELYGDGRVEKLVARAIEGRRDEVFLVSKVMPSNASRAGTITACEQSLRRLRTDRLDLYLLHWPGSHPLRQTLDAFAELERTGKIRFFGLSNFDDKELARAVQIAGESRIAANQVLYHLEERRIEHRLVPACEKHDIAVIGYSPFGSGDFVAPSSPGAQVLSEIAQAHGASVRQVALAFLVRHAGLFAIPKAANEEHVRDNAGAAELELTAEDYQRIDRAFPRGSDRAGISVI